MRLYPMNIASPPFNLFVCFPVIIFLSTPVDSFWKEYLRKIQLFLSGPTDMI